MGINREGNAMSDEQQVPDFAEIIDISSLPDWNVPQIREAFEKIDTSKAGKSPHCKDPACVDGMIALNLNDADDFQKASDSIESYVMGAMFACHEADEEDPAMLQELVDYLLPLPRELLVDVLMSIADAAAGLFIAYGELKGEDGDADV